MRTVGEGVSGVRFLRGVPRKEGVFSDYSLDRGTSSCKKMV